MRSGAAVKAIIFTSLWHQFVTAALPLWPTEWRSQRNKNRIQSGGARYETPDTHGTFYRAERRHDPERGLLNDHRGGKEVTTISYHRTSKQSSKSGVINIRAILLVRIFPSEIMSRGQCHFLSMTR